MKSAAEEIADFTRFCSALKTEGGRPFVLEEFQKVILFDYFDGAREEVVILPKKNGKTTLIAALALFHLLTTENAECIMLASSREQAEIILRQARMFVRQSASLQRHFAISQRTISNRADEGRIRVLASDVDTADGAIPTLAIVDELHRHKSLDLYGVMRDGLGPRNGQIITISTAGASFDSPLGHIRQNAHERHGFKRTGTHNYVRSADGAFAFHEWCLDPEADVEDLDVVKTANPASWQTIDALKVRRQSDSMTLYQWLRFACGIWTEGEEPWIDPETWDSLAADGFPLAEGSDVWLAVCVGNLGEESAIVTVGWDGPTLLAQANVIAADTPRAEIADVIRDLADIYSVEELAFVPRQFESYADLLGDEGIETTEFPLTPERMGRASVLLHGLIEDKHLAHSGDRAFRAHVMAGVVREDRQGWSLVKDPSTHRPVSALLALVMAVQIAMDNEPKGVVIAAWR